MDLEADLNSNVQHIGIWQVQDLMHCLYTFLIFKILCLFLDDNVGYMTISIVRRYIVQ